MRLRIALAAGLIGGLIVGCASATPAATTAPLAGKIRIGGSGAAYPVLQILAKQFHVVHPGVDFEFQPSSTTGAGIQLVSSGGLDLAGLARDRTAEEATVVVEVHSIANDAIVVAVNPTVQIRSLTTAQLRDVYAGKIHTWEQLGATGGGSIVLIDRPEDETAKIVIRHVFGIDLKIDLGAVSMAREADMVAAVEKTPGAIGYFSNSYILEKPDRARVLAIDGVSASLKTIADHSYPAIRKVGFVARPGATGLLGAFITFAESTLPKVELEAAGYVLVVH